MALIITLLVIAVLIIGIVWYSVHLYNMVLNLNQAVEDQYLNIGAQIKQQATLVQNLLSVSRGYFTQNQDVLVKLTQANTALERTHVPADSFAAENMITTALTGFYEATKPYAQLQANQQFLQLQNNLASLHGQIVANCVSYNIVAKTYNEKIKRFPTNFIATSMNYNEAPICKEV